ncbi:MAG: LapA family protein [Desulfovibrionaceae bacterium]|nr:LapA family protein [Desulfovibrionaceae bacterium]MDD4953223.1 LapA family protein [Desulfovibrionaceae bacterium]
MRYLKIVLLVLFFVISMIFFIQNNDILSQKIVLGLNVLFLDLHSAEMPLYFMILAAFLLGAILTTAHFLVEKLRLSNQLRTCRARLSGLEEEVNSLRNLPLDEQSYSGAGGGPED